MRGVSPRAHRGAWVIGTDALRILLASREPSDGQERKQNNEDDPNINAHQSSRQGAVSSLNRLRAGQPSSSRTDRGAQVLPPAGASVPPWLPAKSARASNLPACCALGPPASAAQRSCRREPCNGRSVWLPLGRACLSAWIEHRSGEQRCPSQGLKARPHALNRFALARKRFILPIGSPRAKVALRG